MGQVEIYPSKSIGSISLDGSVFNLLGINHIYVQVTKQLMVNLFTIGFTQKSAETFFSLLMKNKVKRIVDIRINNSSQLAGFAKSDDLKYFAEKIAGIGYIYMPELAPTLEMMRNYRAKGTSWENYEGDFLKFINK